MKTKLLSLVLVIAMVMSLFPGVDASAANDVKGSLLIVGGALGSTNAAVYNRFIELAGGKDKARIGIIPAASSSMKSSNVFKSDLISYGVPETNVEIIPIAVKDDSTTKDVDESRWMENADNAEVINRIKGLSAVWFVGGDQTRITKALLKSDGTNTGALDAIWEVYRNGGAIGGTSAGAAIMSDPMIAGGNSLGALNYGFTETYMDENDQLNGPVYLEKGLGFFKKGIVDQHFDTRARLGRLIVTAYKYRDKSSLAYGVDENTAMVYNAASDTIEVVGKGSVTIVDVSKAAKDESSKIASFRDILISYIVAGDKFDLSKKEFIIDSSKDITNGYEYYAVKGPIANTGILSGYPLLRDFLAYNLTDNSEAASIKSYCFDEKGQGVELVFRKTSETKGYWGYKDGNIDSYSGTNIALDINPVIVKISAAKPQAAMREYVVEKGDVLWKVAEKLGVGLEKLIEANNIKNPAMLVPGQKLAVPQE